VAVASGSAARTGDIATAGDVLTAAELRELRGLSTARGAGLVAHAWAVIVGAMALYAVWPSTPTLLLGIAVVGSRQLGLAVLMHEAAHWRLFEGLRANGWAAKAFCAWPLWVDLKAYRRQHHLHHRHTQREGDPDRVLAAAFPVAPRALWRAAVGDLCGVTAVRLVWSWPGWREPAPLALRRVRGPLASHAALAAVATALGHWECYALLWLVPQLTWCPLVSRLRSLAEHAMVRDDEDPLLNSRTTRAGLAARAFLAPYWVNYHLEHHLLVFVPCWRLPRAHALLQAKGYGPRMEMANGYVEVIRRATSAGR